MSKLSPTASARRASSVACPANWWMRSLAICWTLSIRAELRAPHALDSEVAFPSADVLDLAEPGVGRVAEVGAADVGEAGVGEFRAEGFEVPHPEVCGVAQPRSQGAAHAAGADGLAQVALPHEGDRGSGVF